MLRHHVSVVILALVMASTLEISSDVQADSPTAGQFLGPDRNGVIPATGLLSDWPAGGPNVAWRVPGGVGMSGVAIADQMALTLWNSNEGQVLAALRLKDGSQEWTTGLSPNYENGMGNGPRATPTVDGERVFAYTGEGTLVCVQLTDGKVIWRKPLVREFAGKPAEYGMACSPLVVGDLVIVTVGGRGHAVVALDKASGEFRWGAADGKPGYASPALLTIAGEPQVVAFTGLGVTGIRPADGSLLWQFPFPTPYDCNTATPIEVDGNVFISSGENHGCVMLSVSKQGPRYETGIVWESVDVKSVMRNEWQTSVEIDGYLYGFDNVGSAGPVTHLTCIDAKTGETQWRRTRFGKGNLVAADGKLWVTTMEGELVLIKVSPEEYVELGRKKLFGKTRQALAIAGGRGLIRDDAEVVCIEID
ncbi:MAG: PQQ-binding-like beta-propeller repeat protein [Rubripirellula sp.]